MKTSKKSPKPQLYLVLPRHNEMDVPDLIMIKSVAHGLDLLSREDAQDGECADICEEDESLISFTRRGRAWIGKSPE